MEQPAQRQRAESIPEPEIVRNYILENIEEMFFKTDLGTEIKNHLKENCAECGKGVDGDDLEICLFGSDVLVLFPNIM